MISLFQIIRSQVVKTIRKNLAFLLTILIFLAASTGAATPGNPPSQSSKLSIDISSNVKKLYSKNFSERTQAAKLLSSANESSEIKETIQRLQEELNCISKQPKPSSCHDPKFVYNVILVAKNLAKKNSEDPWEFLMWLQGDRHTWDDPFFLIEEDRINNTNKCIGSDDEKPLYCPTNSNETPTILDLQKFLDDSISEAEIHPTCKWSLQRIQKFAKRQDFKDFQIYRYERIYGYAHTGNRNLMTWIYQGARRLDCKNFDEIVDMGNSKLLGAHVEIRQDDTCEPETIVIYQFPKIKKLCSYTFGDESWVDPQCNHDTKSLINLVFDLSNDTCKPKHPTGYNFKVEPSKIKQ